MDLPMGRETVSSAMPDAVNYHNWIRDLVVPKLGQSVLEVGIGFGEYTREWMSGGRNFTAVDFDPDCVALHRAEYPSIPAIVADLGSDDFVDRVGRASFDSIICINVLEHIRDDHAAVARLAQCLKPGGAALLIVPAHMALYGRMDEIAGHFRRYNKRALRTAIESAGLQPKELRHFNPLGGMGWWANSKFYRPKDLNTDLIVGQVRIFDKYVQPMSRLIDPLTASFFGQSLWAVACAE